MLFHSYFFFLLIINICKELDIWIPNHRVRIPVVDFWVNEKHIGSVLGVHLDDIWIWVSEFFGSGTHGYLYSHP